MPCLSSSAGAQASHWTLVSEWPLRCPQGSAELIAFILSQTFQHIVSQFSEDPDRYRLSQKVARDRSNWLWCVWGGEGGRVTDLMTPSNTSQVNNSSSETKWWSKEQKSVSSVMNMAELSKWSKAPSRHTELSVICLRKTRGAPVYLSDIM